jgi:coenzyme F420-0:L-glutamate ligase/coenzyme F420-1:gamma-L-glutamate ligase
VIAILPVAGLPEVVPGDDLAALISGAAALQDGDVVVVAQKVVSKAEGALVDVPAGEDRAEARRRLARLQSVRVVCDAPFALIVETPHGLICANAGIDASNVPGEQVTLLPDDPDASARALRRRLRELTGADVAVIVADSFGRPWRLGQTDVAIGAAGLRPIRDERGGTDREGTLLEATEVAVADQLAGAADLVRRKADGVPVVIVRGAPIEPHEEAGAGALIRGLEMDLFPHGRGWVADALADRATAAVRGGQPTADELARVRRAGRAVARGLADIDERDGVLHVRPQTGEPAALLAAGAAAGAITAALLDLGYDATWRMAEGAGAVVEIRL